MLAHGEHRARRRADDLVGDAAHHQAGHAAPTVRRHHDEVDRRLLPEAIENLGRRHPEPGRQDRAAALPLMIAVAVTKSGNPEICEEDYAAGMMAVQNISLAAVAIGLGTHIKTGAVMDDPAARSVVGVGDDAAKRSFGERVPKQSLGNEVRDFLRRGTLRATLPPGAE